MSAKEIIETYHSTRAGTLGAEADASAYVGLNHDGMLFSGPRFAGSSFTQVSFRGSVWTGCRFDGCSFAHCELDGLAMSGCTFANCRFAHCSFGRSTLSACSFTQGRWDSVSFDHSQWTQVVVRGCTGTGVRAVRLTGRDVDLTGSFFEDFELSNAEIN